MSDVKVPGVGQVPKPVFIGGIGLLAGILVYAYVKRSRQAAAAAAAPADTTSTDPIDPTTGVPYATELADATAGYNPAQGGNTSYSPYGYDVYGNPLPAPTNAAGAGGIFTSNSDWATAADATLQNNGTDLATASLAVSRVLGGLTVTSAQRDLFMEAVGQLGQPPQGYPQPIKLTDSPAQPSSGGASTAATNAPSGLRAEHITANSIRLAWSAVPGATGYRVFRSGSSSSIGQTSGTSFTVSGLSHSTRYSFHVDAVTASGSLSAPSASVTVATHAK